MEQLQDIAFGITMILAGIACLFLYIRAIVDIHKRKFVYLREKSMWLTLVIAAPLLGSIFYFAMKKQPVNHRLPV
jgi:SNF family Na+-dependent transporter